MSASRPGRVLLAATAALVVGVGLGGCSSAAPATAPTSGGVDNPTISVAPTTSSDTGSSGGPVVVRADVSVARTPAVRSLLAFVRAHAESVRAGRATALLAAVTTPGQLAAQRKVIDFAVTSGYVVPSEPIVHVVSVLDRSPRSTTLAVCFWLPSTEYVDAATGAPTNGPVPDVWAAAVATVRLAGVTWSVDTLEGPSRGTSIRCGGHP